MKKKIGSVLVMIYQGFGSVFEDFWYCFCSVLVVFRQYFGSVYQFFGSVLSEIW